MSGQKIIDGLEDAISGRVERTTVVFPNGGTPAPLDLSSWQPDDIIRRWQEAYVWANGKKAPEMRFERGWFLCANGEFPPYRYRRRMLAEMTADLENRPPAKKESAS